MWSGRTPARAARDHQRDADLQQQYELEKFSDFSDGCRGGDPTACFSLGEFYALVRKDFTTAARLYETNCDERRHKSSCNNLGHLYGVLCAPWPSRVCLTVRDDQRTAGGLTSLM